MRVRKLRGRPSFFAKGLLLGLRVSAAVMEGAALADEKTKTWRTATDRLPASKKMEDLQALAEDNSRIARFAMFVQGESRVSNAMGAGAA